MMNEIIVGDALEELKKLPEGSVHCVVTSPPYYNLRDYGIEGQLGLEETLDDYIAGLVGVFREIRRVLRDDGTVWLNISDSYATSGGDRQRNWDGRKKNLQTQPDRRRRLGNGFKQKDLMMIPARLAIALHADGWWLRQDIIWYKPNPMPEAVKDRCVTSHEHIFLLTKRAKYYYDADAISNDNGTNRHSVWEVAPKGYGGAHFAVYPEELITPCILAGCPRGGVVLDPFLGSGTTSVVALKHGRQAIGIELNPEYAELARERIAKVDKSLNLSDEREWI